jgi:hypothetical protein
MTNAKQIADADERRRGAECAELESRIQLAILRQQITVLETAEAKRQRILIQTAVERLVTSGVIHADDHAGQFDLTEQFIKDPSGLIPLALRTKIFRAGSAVNR